MGHCHYGPAVFLEELKMNLRRNVIVIASLFSAAAFAQAGEGKWTSRALKGEPIFATVETNHGKFVIELFSKDAPKTVANFAGLAAGEREWTHPGTQEKSKKKLFDGTLFHRIIPGFMIQGGDPLGKGYGGPGYLIEDEFQSGRGFDRPYLLAMANPGRPNSNGSQFFITVIPDPSRGHPSYLNNRHTIFGEVISGQDVVEKISKVETSAADNRPTKDVVMKKITLADKPPKGVKSSASAAPTAGSADGGTAASNAPAAKVPAGPAAQGPGAGASKKPAPPTATDAGTTTP
jgi:peptidyl-prolyl cis-trans isomerase A (cyclophilin A)